MHPTFRHFCQKKANEAKEATKMSHAKGDIQYKKSI